MQRFLYQALCGKRIIFLLVALFFCCTLTACITVTKNPTKANVPENSPESVMLRMVEVIQAENAQALLKLVHMADTKQQKYKKKKAYTESIWLEQAKQAVALGKMLIQQQGGVASIATGEPQYSDDGKKAEVTLTIQFRNGNSRTTLRTLVLVNNRWMLNIPWQRGKQALHWCSLPFPSSPRAISNQTNDGAFSFSNICMM